LRNFALAAFTTLMQQILGIEELWRAQALISKA
jgi:hypothetical protein